MNRPVGYVLLCALAMTAGGFFGHYAHRFFASFHPETALARQIQAEERAQDGRWTVKSVAFRKSGKSIEGLYASAREIEAAFRIGSIIFGVWCGLTLALKIIFTLHPPRRVDYEADPAWCVACARCYRYCPREVERLKKITGTGNDAQSG